MKRGGKDIYFYSIAPLKEQLMHQSLEKIFRRLINRYDTHTHNVMGKGLMGWGGGLSL